MAENYSVKINRRDRSIEVSGDKEWVEAKLAEFADVLTAPFSPAEPNDQGAVTGDAQPGRPRRKRKARSAMNGQPKQGRRRTNGLTRVKGLDLAPKGKQSFDDFVVEKQPKSQHDRSTASVYYLSEVAEITPVTVNHVYTCYRDQNWDMPPDLRASLFLTASKKGFIDTSDLEDIKIEPRGVNRIERGLPTKKKES
jgi:hypothetical protein